jgi:hypothetical protein
MDSLKVFLTLQPAIPAEFLSDIIAFEAAIAAIAVPLSFEMVSRISERYHSDVLNRVFLRDPLIKWFPRVILLHLLLVIASKFLRNNSHELFWHSVDGALFVYFVIVVIMFSLFLWRLRIYLTDTSYVLGILLKRANEVFTK